MAQSRRAKSFFIVFCSSLLILEFQFFSQRSSDSAIVCWVRSVGGTCRLKSIKSIARIQRSGGTARAVEGKEDIDALRRQFRQLARNENLTTWHWRQHCSEANVSSSDPECASVDLLQTFLEGCEDSLGGPVVHHWGQGAPEVTCQKLYNILGHDRSTPWHWAEYCKTDAYGIASPDRMPGEIVKEFLMKRAKGTLPKLTMASKETVSKLMELQKACRSWVTYCKCHSHGILDPNRFPEDIAQQILEDLKPQGPALAAKIDLHDAVQRFLKRNPTQQEIMYTVESSSAPYVGTVTLTGIIRGPTDVSHFVGDASSTNYEAQVSAAAKALAAMPALEKSEPRRSKSCPTEALFDYVVDHMPRHYVKGDIVYTFDSDSPPYRATISIDHDILESGDGDPIKIRGDEVESRSKAKRNAAEKAVKALKIMMRIADMGTPNYNPYQGIFDLLR